MPYIVDVYLASIGRVHPSARQPKCDVPVTAYTSARTLPNGDKLRCKAEPRDPAGINQATHEFGQQLNVLLSGELGFYIDASQTLKIENIDLKQSLSIAQNECADVRAENNFLRKALRAEQQKSAELRGACKPKAEVVVIDSDTDDYDDDNDATRDATKHATKDTAKNADLTPVVTTKRTAEPPQKAASDAARI
jgi:hypothetical protein